jgi:hypothetical protein
METDETSWLEYFSGGVPTSEFFRLTLEDVREISKTSLQNGINRVQELCFIGLMSYFEAFCKDHFASLINIEPSLVVNLKANGQNVDIDSTRAVIYGEAFTHRIGFVLAEKYDFGSSKKINSLFLSLLKVTPFSSSEVKQYDDLLRDRNLLVHHSGTFTLTYLEQTNDASLTLESNAFFNSRVIRQAEVIAAIEFIETVADKLVLASHSALVQHLAANNIQYSGERKKALDFMLGSKAIQRKSKEVVGNQDLGH